MTTILPVTKSASVNPLKSSQPLGAAFAFLGVDRCVPLFHGSQGCTSFALVLFVRHFKETIPLQTTAMDEVATIMGGADHLEEAILNLKSRTKPELIGVCTTALVETRGEDFAGDLATIRARRAEALAGTEVVLAATPDFTGSIEEGWSKAVVGMIETIVDRTPQRRDPRRVAVLPGWNLTVADIEEIRDTIEAFGLEPVILPDVSGALDGTVPGKWIPTTYGGTRVADIRSLGSCVHTLAIGEGQRAAAEALEAVAGVPFTLFETLTGLKPVDRFVTALAELSGAPVPAKLRRRRSQLADALLDGHFHFGGKKIAIAAEPDHLFQLSTFFVGMGAEIVAAVTTTGTSPILRKVPADTVKVGDFGDFETLAVGADLLVGHSHARQAAERLDIPLMRVGFPVFDRLGAQHRCHVGWSGTRDLIFEVSNIFQANVREPTPDALNPLLNREAVHDRRTPPDARAH
ncbi:nitrogenase iron-molybdenum cofactor biosynthesis protein NifN [Siculibacillus lacustris]|uniref:Nitrogenase iron-molybdenum cofactor biosynthesis protein NifN n=1 Tax=Siculibacillus lacustris TaxID=1549641 RepID=A0A4Q9VRI0_9HYPH|nr:nitrogenase iron-molybdenum cofactor biosynthesis protein NifN [Siculibacillus lacustris]TBW38014.1 nitrogenase iron-molybdenum cofactor biosynthesis protein NifN [Siculibacillus lacustris]